MKQRALAGPRRSDDRDLFAGFDRERNVVDRKHIRPRRISKTDIFKTDIAARRLWQRYRLRRRRDLRFYAQDLEQPLGGAGRSRDLAPDLAELPETAGGKRRIQHELAEPARRDLPGQHVVRTDPEDRHDAGEHDEDDDQRQHRARPRRAARRLIGLFDLAAEATGRQPLAGIGLHGPDRADQFGGVGAGVRQRILRVARQPPHPAPERYQWNHDQRDRQQHEARQFRTRDHHHGGGADEQHDVAQRDRYRRADGGFDLGGIGRQPGH